MNGNGEAGANVKERGKDIKRESADLERNRPTADRERNRRKNHLGLIEVRLNIGIVMAFLSQ
jgi:hypothetical protein